MILKLCQNCQYYNRGHDACYFPAAFHRGDEWPWGFGFMEPGDCREINKNFDCQWYDASPPASVPAAPESNRVDSDMPNFSFRRFLRRLLKPLKIRITK